MIKIDILTAPGCSHCEQALRAIQRVIERLRNKVSDIEVEVIDITRRPEVAVKYMVMSTPAVAVDGKLAFVGVPKEDALIKKLLKER
ncbi:MAG: thioredoxin family protein [Nitrososphaerales archaeon]